MSARLSSGGRVDRQRVVNFSVNGRAFKGLQGDTLASALLANGVSLVARSWKYHRPRGILSAGVEEPNALVQLFDGARTVPNARMTEVSLVEGLNATSIHASPSVEFDVKAVNGEGKFTHQVVLADRDATNPVSIPEAPEFAGGD